MQANSKPSNLVALFLAAFLPCTFVATGNEGKPSLVLDAGWVESHEAGYTNVEGELSGRAVTGTRHAELPARALPKSRVTILKTQDAWDKFVEQFAKIDEKSGKPTFVSGSGFFEEAKRTDFLPNFDSEAVLIFAADKIRKKGGGSSMDVEVFEDKDCLRTFAFFTAQSGKAVVPDDAPEDSATDHLYVFTIPRKMADQPVELRIALQSWGRVCSKFSQPIINSKATENKPDK